jgi:hypothetical protein
MQVTWNFVCAADDGDRPSPPRKLPGKNGFGNRERMRRSFLRAFGSRHKVSIQMYRANLMDNLHALMRTQTWLV